MPNGVSLTISSRQKDGKLELSFADTGMGIPIEKMDKLWTPFVTTKAKGMGLGLPISKRILEAHGGQITCASAAGKGTTFTLFLPLNGPENNNVEFFVPACSSIFENSSKNHAGLESKSELRQEENGGER